MKLVKTESVGSDLGWIGRDVQITGDVIFADQFRVDGKVKGKVISEKGTLIIGDSGHIEAQVAVGVCIIQGTLKGDLDAKTRVEIHKSGQVHGDVVTPVLIVEEGALFNGAVRMGQEAAERLLEEVIPAGAEKQRKGA